MTNSCAQGKSGLTSLAKGADTLSHEGVYRPLPEGCELNDTRSQVEERVQASLLRPNLSRA